MTVNAATLNLIRTFEGCSLKPYLDGAGVCTIGFGHTGDDITMGMQDITQSQAEAWLEEDLEDAEDEIDQHINVDLNENQYGALTSLVFNCGNRPLLGHVGMYCNASEWQNAADAFLQWDNIDGQPSPGLARRRGAERQLFLTDVT